MDVKYRWEFFPRRVSDVAGLMDHLHGSEPWNAIQEVFSLREGKLDRVLTPEERVVIINNLVEFGVVGLD